MKRCITIALIIIISFLLQSTVFQYLKLADVVPNLLLIVTMTFGLMRGRREGVLVGFFCGILVDIFFGSVLGPYAFVYMTLGYVNGFFHRIYYASDVYLPLIMITVNDFVYNMFIFVMFFMLRNKLSFGKYFKSVILPEMIYTIIITLVLYKILVKINLLLKQSKEAN